MLTIVRSKFCLQHFRNELDQSPFYFNQAGIDYQVLDMPVEADRLDRPGQSLLLYTNIWPITNDVDVISLVARQVSFNSSGTALVAGLNNDLTTVVYPRKGDVHFPAEMVGYITLLPGLLWSATMQHCFFESVSLAMFAELAWDITFPNIIKAGHIDKQDLFSVFKQEYNDALKSMDGLGFEIHGYRQQHAVPYALRRASVVQI